MSSNAGISTLQRLLRAKSVGYIGGLALVYAAFCALSTAFVKTTSLQRVLSPLIIAPLLILDMAYNTLLPIFIPSAIRFNQMTGPAIPFTSANFQDPGWLFTGIMYIFFTIVSGFSMLYLVEAIQCIPGNAHFQGDVEYGTLINFYFGKDMHILAQILLYGALQSSAIQCIVLTAQATDNLMINVFGGTCGLSFTDGWVCVTTQNPNIPSPFGNAWMVFTVGLLIVAIISAPLAIADLENNVLVNIVMAILSAVLGASWVASAFVTGMHPSRVPAVRPLSIKYGQVIGTVMLNLGCSIIIPSWINLRHKNVNIQNVIWIATIVCSLYYIIIGVICGMGFELDKSGDLLHSLLISGKPRIIAEISIGFFAYVMLLPGIPFNFLVSRNNLIQNEVSSPMVANFFAFVFPWILSIPIQTGSYVFEFQNWMALIFCSTANFLVPFAVYFQCVKFRREYNRNRVFTHNQIKLLRLIHKISDRITDYIDKKHLQLLDGPSKTEKGVMAKPPKISLNDDLIPSPMLADVLSKMVSESTVMAAFLDARSSETMFIQASLDSKAPDQAAAHDAKAHVSFVVSSDTAENTQAPRHGKSVSHNITDTKSLDPHHASASSHSRRKTSSDGRQSRHNSSQQARDSQYVLRPGNTDNDTMFKNAAFTGIPRSILEMDIPESDVLRGIRSSDANDRLVSGTGSVMTQRRSPSSVGAHGPVAASNDTSIENQQLNAFETIPSGSTSVQDEKHESMLSPPTPGRQRSSYLRQSDAQGNLAFTRSRSSPIISDDGSPRMGDKEKRRANSNDDITASYLSRSTTLESLPREPDYFGEPFLILPSWLPIPVGTLALGLACITTVLCVANIVFTAYVEIYRIH